jgi:dTDP-4-amino-4,6-dideoxygalactose transaminase
VFEPEQIELAAEVLRSGRVNYWTGSECRLFEDEYAGYLGMPCSVAVMNGTVALELALRSLGVGQGDEVIVPCRTFIASASCVAAVGAIPVLCDIDPSTHTLSADTVRAVLGSRTRAVIAVHLGGMPCEMTSLPDLCRQEGLLLIEDCAQAHGARFGGRPVGSFGDAAAFSFCQDKIITTGGEGGLVAFRSPEAGARAGSYRDHGRDLREAASSLGSDYRYVYGSFGTNFRMTEMQAALGRWQLRRLESSVQRRRENADRLARGLLGVHGVALIDEPALAYHAYYKFYFMLELEKLSPEWSRARVLEAIAAEGVPAGVGSCPDIGREGAFRGISNAEGARRGAAHVGERAVMLQVHPTLSESDIDDCVRAVTKVLQVATR